MKYLRNLFQSSFGGKKKAAAPRRRSKALECLESRLPFAVELLSEVGGTAGNSYSEIASISDDGRYVAFTSYANNLVAGDTNNNWDVFVRDRDTGIVSLVSSDVNGTLSNSSGRNPIISGNGRYVAFESQATNLIPGDTAGDRDIYVKDLQTGALIHASVDDSGTNYSGDCINPSISFDGRFVSFQTAVSMESGDNNGVYDLYVKDLALGDLQGGSTDSSNSFVSQGAVYRGLISGDGNYTVFSSHHSSYVAGDTNNTYDIFVKNLQTGAVNLVSSDAQGNIAAGSSYFAEVSLDGAYVTFASTATNLTSDSLSSTYNLFRKNIATGAVELVNVDPTGTYFANAHDLLSTGHSMSDDGNIVVFTVFPYSGPLTGSYHVFAKNLTTGDVRWLDTIDGTTPADDFSWEPRINGAGNVVVFSSYATNLSSIATNGVTQVYSVNLNAAPVANTDYGSALPGEEIDIDVVANDTDGDLDTLTVTAVGTPSHGTTVINQDGTVKYTPDSASIRADSFTYTVDDGQGNAVQGTVNVTLNTDPETTTDGLVTQLDEPILIAPLYNDEDADGDSLSIASITQPTSGTAQLFNGIVVSYTPNQGFYGLDSFTYQADDGFGGIVQGTIEVFVNRGPTAADDRVVTLMNQSTLIAPLFNDVDPDGDSLAVASIGAVTGGSASIVGGQIHFTPTANFTGLATIEYTITDGHLAESTATVTVQVFDVTRYDGDRLWVQGYNANETFVVRPAANSAPGIELLYNNVLRGTFNVASVVVLGMGGNDHLSVLPRTAGNTLTYVQIPVSLHGNDGNDVLNSSSARVPSILVGGAGNDSLVGSPSRDILAGGAGIDSIDGGGEEDILIGGNFFHEYSQTTYDALMSEWARGDATFDVRKNHITGALSGGANGSVFLNSNVMIDDNARDTFFGRGGRDWFFAELNNSNVSLRDVVLDNSGDDLTSL